MNFVYYLDNYDEKFEFLFNGSKKLYTPLGIILSLINIILCIIYSSFLLNQLINHKNPSIIYEKITTSNRLNMTFNKDLIYTINFRDSEYNIINDKSIGYIEGIYERTFVMNGTFQNSKTKLNFMNCSNLYDNFKKINQEKLFNSLSLSQYICFENFNEPIILGGVYGSEFYGNIAIYIKKCKNESSSDIICKDQETIDKTLQNGWLQVSYISAFIDYNNYKNPIQYKLLGSYGLIDININKIIYSYFNHIYIYSDNGIIFPIKKKEKSIKEESIIRDINLVRDEGIVYTLYLCPSDTVEKYKRSYIKIHNIGSTVAGIYIFIHSITTIFFGYYKNKLIDKILIDNLFTISSKYLNKNKYSLFKLNKNIKNITKKYDDDNSISNINNFSIINNSNKILNLSNTYKNFNKVTINNKLNSPYKYSNYLLIHNNRTYNKLKNLKYYKFKIGFIETIKMCFLPFLSSSHEYFKEYKFIKYQLNNLIDYKNVNIKLNDINIIKEIFRENNIFWNSDKKVLNIVKNFEFNN